MHRVLLSFVAGTLCLWASGCATVPGVERPDDVNPPNSGSVIVAAPEAAPIVVPPATSPPAPAPAPPADRPAPVVDVPMFESPLRSLEFWAETDTRPALQSFRESCAIWARMDSDKPLNPNLPEYGVYGDWVDPCQLAAIAGDSPSEAKAFFENQFAPVPLIARNAESGLLTGYYQPEIEVRRVPTPEFSEAILAVPSSESVQTLPRAKLGPTSARVIAYGRPLEVFFMQIQGSGHIRFSDGRLIRAAFAGHNSLPYTSIGGVLIRRGEVTKDKSSKRDIENWMRKAGPKAARDLMNENQRYIFFIEQNIEPGKGPNGAMRVPLTAMGSMAVDPRYHPYGALIWLEGKFPREAGDYRGKTQGALLSAQDTGKAIVGAMRGDVFFGSGDAAGDLAGVMKHPAQWTLFLPRALAAKLARERAETQS